MCFGISKDLINIEQKIDAIWQVMKQHEVCCYSQILQRRQVW